MELIKEIEFTTPVTVMTVAEVEKIIEDGTLQELVHYMSKQKIAYLHARQVGIEMNFFVWQYKNAWKLCVNPKVMGVNKKAKLLNTFELSYTNRTEKGTAKMFQTKRVQKCMGVFDNYKSKGFKRSSVQLKGLEASVFQQLTDISNGKNITRFEGEVAE